MRTKRRGFASFSKSKHRKASSKGGSRKVPKGVALLPTEDRIVRARSAANARWEKVREAKRAEEQPINSAEDGGAQEDL